MDQLKKFRDGREVFQETETAADGLRARGANVSEVCLYEWRLPDDLAPRPGQQFAQRRIAAHVGP
jgi:hypothetical protein